MSGPSPDRGGLRVSGSEWRGETLVHPRGDNAAGNGEATHRDDAATNRRKYQRGRGDARDRPGLRYTRRSNGTRSRDKHHSARSATTGSTRSARLVATTAA